MVMVLSCAVLLVVSVTSSRLRLVGLRLVSSFACVVWSSWYARTYGLYCGQALVCCVVVLPVASVGVGTRCSNCSMLYACMYQAYPLASAFHSPRASCIRISISISISIQPQHYFC